MRDALWYGDGTKLNYYYLNDEGKMDTCCVYEVMDVYSEVLLGFYISKKEDFESQYFAYKMAMQFSGHKPYEIRFDNQGGHGKLKNGSFFKEMARLWQSLGRQIADRFYLEYHAVPSNALYLLYNHTNGKE